MPGSVSGCCLLAQDGSPAQLIFSRAMSGAIREELGLPLPCPGGPCPLQGAALALPWVSVTGGTSTNAGDSPTSPGEHLGIAPWVTWPNWPQWKKPEPVPCQHWAALQSVSPASTHPAAQSKTLASVCLVPDLTCPQRRAAGKQAGVCTHVAHSLEEGEPCPLGSLCSDVWQ